MEMKIYERSLQALLSLDPRSRVLARRLASLAQIRRACSQTIEIGVCLCVLALSIADHPLLKLSRGLDRYLSDFENQKRRLY